MNTAQMGKVLLHIMIEGDKAENNYTAYIPELRLGAVGETAEEARSNAISLASMEKERILKSIKSKNELIFDSFELRF